MREGSPPGEHGPGPAPTRPEPIPERGSDAPKLAAPSQGDFEPVTIGERLRVQAAERGALRRMSPAERKLAYERGELTTYQRSLLSTLVDEVTFKTRNGEAVALSMSRPQIGLINGELPWIAATLADNERD